MRNNDFQIQSIQLEASEEPLYAVELNWPDSEELSRQNLIRLTLAQGVLHQSEDLPVYIDRLLEFLAPYRELINVVAKIDTPPNSSDEFLVRLKHIGPQTDALSGDLHLYLANAQSVAPISELIRQFAQKRRTHVLIEVEPRKGSGIVLRTFDSSSDRRTVGYLANGTAEYLRAWLVKEMAAAN